MTITIGQLRETLLRSRNTDGGWPYHPGKTTRLEPTVWASLALYQDGHRNQPGDQPHFAGETLRTWPSRDGVLLERSGGDANYAFHGLALVAFHACGIEHAMSTAALLDGVQKVKGITLEQSPYFRQDNSLQGWPWTASTFSWVEPTACCLLALKKWSRVNGAAVDSARIDEAERLLLDRVCAGGGWNYGNSRVMQQDLQPYVPTTALALLAMQDRRAEAAVQRSLTYLEANALSERSASALALASLALRIYNRPVAAIHAALIDQLPVTMTLSNQAALAMALYALRTDHADHAIRL